MKPLEEIKAMRDDLANEKLLQAAPYTFGYATAGREINAILESYKEAFAIGFDAALELMEEREKHYREVICAYKTITHKDLTTEGEK